MYLGVMFMTIPSRDQWVKPKSVFVLHETNIFPFVLCAGKAVSIDIDGSENTEIFEINLPDPLDLSITAMYLGGSKEEVTLGSPNPVPGKDTSMAANSNSKSFVVSQ